MKKRSFILVINLLSILFGVTSSGFCNSENVNLRFQYLTTDDGLAQNTVDCIFQDSYGFMWFGTWNGLCRYDGYNFKIFQKSDSQKSIPDNFVHALCEDSTGNLWIGTSHGLGGYNLKSEKFDIPENLKVVFEKLIITSLVCDHEGGFWVAAEKGNLYHVIPEFDQEVIGYKCQKIDTNQLHEADVNSVYVLKNGQIIVGTGIGLYEVKLDRLQKLSFSGDSSKLLELVTSPF